MSNETKALSISFRSDDGCIEHNNRDFFTDNVDKSRTPNNINYVKRDLRGLYHELFDEALAEYNARQNRPDRQIQDYYGHIRKSKKEKLFQEIIVMFGNSENCGVGSENWETAKIMLEEYMRDFEKRNPNLKVFNAVMHLDEATPHLHIDFVPVCCRQKQGLSTRVSMNNYRMEGKSVCTHHRITALNLYNAVLADIKRLAGEALGDDKQMISAIAARLGKSEKENVRQAERELKRANKRLSELDRLFAKLYEEHVNGKVNERNYNSMSASYENEQTELEYRISELNAAIKTERENDENAVNFVDLIKQYADIDELSQALLNTLIDRIEVHEPEDVDGELIQKLDVYYKFVGRLD